MTLLKSNPAPTSLKGRLFIDRVTHRFPGAAMPVLSDLTIDCKPGEFVVVVGPSGCGKSTLLMMAAGMMQPDSGSVRLDDELVQRPGPQRAVVFQEPALFPWLTASQNVEFGLKMAGVARSERGDRAAAGLKAVHLSRAGHLLVHQLSGGMRQRIAIARALALNPAVLLMDEPFAALDAQTRTLLHQQLQELWLQTRKTILFVTHSVGEAVRLADRIIVLHAQPGRIRKAFDVPIAHPRPMDSADINELARLVRKEIEEEVNRVNAAQNEDPWKPATPDDLGASAGFMGDGI